MTLRNLIITLISILTLTLADNAAAQQKSVGDATYYGHRFHGRRTSDGSTYHRDSLTCAHRTLPFGTLLKVRNTKNGREVVVKVTDRGPFRRGGIVDLSYAAAKQIDMVGSGVVRVEVEPVTTTEAAGYLAAHKSEPISLPELQLLDPASGEYLTMTEWLRRGQEEREKAKAAAARRSRTSYLANNKNKKPLWQPAGTSLTAQAASSAAKPADKQ